MRRVIRTSASVPICLLFLVSVRPDVATAETDGETGNQRLPVPGLEPAKSADRTFNPLIEHIRSPSGLYYYDPRVLPPARTYGDWSVNSALAIGGLVDGGSSDATGFVQYGDWEEGVVADVFVRARNEKTGSYLRFSSGSLGRADQFMRIDAGRPGRVRLSAFAERTPSVAATNARVLWSGGGTGRLQLPAGLTPGASTLADVAAAFDTVRDSRIAVERDSYGLAMRITPNTRTSISANAVTEGRNGSRIFGGATNFPLAGGYAETVAPVDYNTTNLKTSLRYAGEEHLFNVSLAASFFRNDEPSLVWDNPGLALGFFSFQPAQGQSALPPDNDYLNLKVDYATSFDFWRSRLSLTGSYSEYDQNDELLAPAIGEGVAPGAIAVIFDEWNTNAALSRSRADANLQQWLGRLQLTMQPSRSVSLLARVRATDQSNDTSYVAQNPLNGLFGYVPLDGAINSLSPAGLYDPANPVTRVRIRNIPYETDVLVGTLEAGIRVGKRSRLTLGLHREEKQYAFRERSETDDNSLEVAYARRGAGSLRLRFRYTDRGGSAFNDDYLEPFFSSSLPGYQPAFPDGDRPFGLADLRRYDLADRKTKLADIKYILVPAENLDVTLSARWRDDNYDASFGLRDSSTWTVNLDSSLQLGFNSYLYAYYSFQNAKRDVSGIKAESASSPDATAGSANFPLENAWSESADEDNHAAGIGFHKSAGDVDFDISYSYADSSASLNYGFVSPSAYQTFAPLDPDEVGSGFPATIFRHQVLEAKVRWQFSERVALRLHARYEKEDIDDFHYDGLRNLQVPLPGAADLYLGAIPRDYSANIVIAQIEIAL